MGWLKQLPEKQQRGSRPRCVLLMDGGNEEVADRLTDLVGLPNEVIITCKDLWRPFGKTDVREAQLDVKSTSILPCSHRKKLRDWWLVKGRANRVGTLPALVRSRAKEGYSW